MLASFRYFKKNIFFFNLSQHRKRKNLVPNLHSCKSNELFLLDASAHGRVWQGSLWKQTMHKVEASDLKITHLQLIIHALPIKAEQPYFFRGGGKNRIWNMTQTVYSH